MLEARLERNRELIYSRVLEDLKKRSTVGMYFYIVVTVFVLLVDAFYVRHPTFSLLFISLMLGIAVFRILHSQFFARMESLLGKEGNYYLFLVSVYLTSLVWGLGFAYFMIQPGEAGIKMLMMISTAGLGAGGVVAFIPVRKVAVTYALLMFLPSVCLLLLLQGNLALSFLIVLYVIYMAVIAYRGNREYWQALNNEYELEKKKQAIQEMSRLDSLTGLYNRSCLDEIYGKDFQTARRNKVNLSLILCDIDHFKPINDTYGHIAGDEYLKKIAEVLTQIFQRETDFLFRYGGEEFLVILLGQGKEEALRLAEKARLQVQGTVFPYDGSKINTTMSFGVVSKVPEITDTQEIFLEKADKALYQAKNTGRNRVVLYSGD